MIRFALFLAVGAPVTLVFSALAVVGGLVGARRGWFDWIHRRWSRILLATAGVRVETEGLEHVARGGPQVLVANHQSLFDILALFVALPVSLRFVAKAELSRVPVFGAAMRRAGHVFIDRADRVQAVEAMRAAGERMKAEGLTLGLFPEGTRSRDGELKRFRRGTFVLAIETQSVVVPVALEGGAEILPAGGRRLEPGTVRIRCGPPVELEGMTRDDRDHLLRSCRETIRRLLDGLRQDVGGRASGAASPPEAPGVAPGGGPGCPARAAAVTAALARGWPRVSEGLPVEACLDRVGRRDREVSACTSGGG